MKISLPSSWTGVSLDKFPLIHDVLQDDGIDLIDKEIRIISILSDVSVSTIERIELGDLKNLIKKVRFIFEQNFPKPTQSFKFEGLEWRVNYNVAKLNGGDLITLLKLTETEDSVMANLAEITAVFVKPYKSKWFKSVEANIDYDDKLSMIKRMNAGLIYPMCVFFCKLLTALLPDIKLYLENQNEKAMERIKSILEQNKINTQIIGGGM